MKEDKRYIDTENKIRKSFMKIIKKDGFQKTSVSAIIKDAKINRSTFYLHYTDKYALLASIEKDIFDEIQEIIEHFFKENNSINFIELMKMIAKYIEKNKDTFVLLNSSKGDLLFMKKYGDIIRNSVFKNKLADKIIDYKEEYMLSAYEGIIMNLFFTWINRGFKENSDEYVNIVIELIQNIKNRTDLLE